jgi:para-aminobenzoate synthetase component 1
MSTCVLKISVRSVALPHSPRDTFARLRALPGHGLLESALQRPGLGDWSYISGPARATLYTAPNGLTQLLREGQELSRWADPIEALAACTGDAATPQINGHRPPGLDFIGGWIGALSYDLARHIERLPTLAAADPALPLMHWAAVDQVLAFDHAAQQWWEVTVQGPHDAFPWNDGHERARWDHTLALAAANEAPAALPWRAGPRTQRMDRAGYEAGVERIREWIAAGDVFQVNLTRREEAAFEGDAWALYEALAAAHPAPFGAFIEGPGFAIASCSPERFLKLRGREVEARPMKGTAPRHADAAQDAAERNALGASIKNRAENVMIVDLMRNDLSRVAELGSVRVPELFALEPYAGVWQMVSAVRATLRAGVDAASLLRACWPPGSMTGAPKVRAMEIIEALEPVQRGFYSGSVGYLSCDGSMDLSVVIRSAVVAGGRVMLQFGGGIVADSDPAAEWAETLAKGGRLTAVLDAQAHD